MKVGKHVCIKITKQKTLFSAIGKIISLAEAKISGRFSRWGDNFLSKTLSVKTE